MYISILALPTLPYTIDTIPSLFAPLANTGICHLSSYLSGRMALMIPGSGILFMVREAITDLTDALSPLVNLYMFMYSPFMKINLHVLGRYFSINFIKSSNEKGFLNISLTPISLISWSRS